MAEERVKVKPETVEVLRANEGYFAGILGLSGVRQEIREGEVVLRGEDAVEVRLAAEELREAERRGWADESLPAKKPAKP